MFKVNTNLAKCNVARTIRFTEKIYLELQEISDREKISFNQLVLQCCQYAIDEYSDAGDTDA